MTSLAHFCFDNDARRWVHYGQGRRSVDEMLAHYWLCGNDLYKFFVSSNMKWHQKGSLKSQWWSAHAKCCSASSSFLNSLVDFRSWLTERVNYWRLQLGWVLMQIDAANGERYSSCSQWCSGSAVVLHIRIFFIILFRHSVRFFLLDLFHLFRCVNH